MSRKARLTNEQRIKAVEEYLKGESSQRSIANKYGINNKTFQELLRKAKAALRRNKRNNGIQADDNHKSIVSIMFISTKSVFIV